MTLEFLPVGASFEIEGSTYVVIERPDGLDFCIGCDFFDGYIRCKNPRKTPMCIKRLRKDKKSVIFKKIK